MRTWIVDTNNVNKLSPIGTTGELLLDGPALARGYLNDSAKTAAAFIPLPTWAKGLTDSKRMYRTGDLVKYSPSGSLLYIGRNDSQVKIRGNRIQLEEIQGCIAHELPGTSIAVEAVQPVDKKVKELCVFIVLASDSGETVQGDTMAVNDNNAKEHIASLVKGLKQRLAKTLPSYMLPRYFVPVYRLPRTKSDKLDRKLLVKEAEKFTASELSSVSEFSEEPKRSPKTSSQVFFQSLWAEVLGIKSDHIGLDDDFIEIGGDSISAMQLSALARSRNWKLSVTDIFAQRTLEGVSAVAAISEREVPEEIVPFRILNMDAAPLRHELSKMLNIPLQSIQDPLPCTPFQEDMVLQSLRVPGAATMRFVYNIAGFDITRFKAAWLQCQETHTALRTRIVRLRETLIQVIVDENPQWTIAKNLDEFLENDRQSPMTLGGRLNRCAYVFESEGLQFFVWTAHHAIYDGWAQQELLRDVCERYSGTTSTFPDPGPANFLNYITGLDRDAMATFWRGELSDLASKPLLGVEWKDTPCAEQWEVRRIDFCLPPGRPFTPAMLLQFSWALLVSVASASDDIVLELMLTGRTAPVAGLANTLVPTVAVVPLRFRYSQDEKVIDALQKMQSHTHALIEYEQFGYQPILALDRKIGQLIRRCAVPLIIHPIAAHDSDIAPNLKLANISPMAPPNVAIQLDCSLDKDGAEAMVVFDDNLFSKHQVERLLNALETTVAAVLHADANCTLEFILDSTIIPRLKG